MAKHARAKTRVAAVAVTSPSALKLLKTVSSPRPSQEELEALAGWLNAIQGSLRATVGEHTVLLLAQRNGFFERHLVSLRPLAEQSLAASWENLTGKRSRAKIRHLPESVLEEESELWRLLYESAYWHGSRGLLFQGPARNFFRRLHASTFFTWTNLCWALSGMILLAYGPSRGVELGVLFGLLGAGLNEYMVHLGVGHASDHLAAVYRRLGWGGRYAEEIVLAHRVHHAKMQTDFRVEFSRSTTRTRVEKYLAQEARAIVEARVAEGITPEAQAEAEIARICNDVRVGGYGVNGTTIGWITMQVLALPYFALNFALAPFCGGLWFLVPATISLSGFIAQSMYSHRYLHFSLADQERMDKNGELSRIMMLFMRSPLGRLQVRRHYRHHQEKMDYARTVNGDIMAFNVADFLLRRGVVEAEVPQLLKMHAEGFL